jgi:23S rRNA (cytidine1920-2'-O)/16S rRNA (cytidine1409-2'-O)-methyltransferase
MKKRLDALLVERGLAASRERARALILAGAVTVDGVVPARPGASVPTMADITVQAPDDMFVSRGAHKLTAALDAFEVSVSDGIALDAGASTGGFTDVLLRRGAARVYAVDVGYGQLAWRLRQDPRVVVMERTNIRHLEALPELVDLVTVDVSFISLTLLFRRLLSLASPLADAIALIKPQFEAGREAVGKGGVVRDPAVHREVLERVLSSAQDAGWQAVQVIASPLLGPAGNREFLAHLSRSRAAPTTVKELVAAVV